MQSVKSMISLSVLVLCVASVLTLAGCTTSDQISAGNKDLARATRGVVGTSLIGVKGKTPKDQEGVDDSVAGLCAVGSYTKTECARHQKLTEDPS